MKLGPPPGGEFELIRQLLEQWGPLAVGIGDDASVLRPPRGEQMVISTDASVEGVHFRREWFTLEEIGYRAVTGALSDLAAMAAAPLGVLVSIQVRGDRRSDLTKLAEGIAVALRTANTVVIGGNLTRGDALAITTTVVGSAYSPLTRGGARPGDLLYVTGKLGGPNAALRAWRNGATPPQELRDRMATVQARIAEARWLAARGAIAAIDISDGLSSDAGHLAAASDVGLEIRIESVPVFPAATEEDALAGGEEYELLVAARAPLQEDEFSGRFKLPLTLIGRAVERGVTGVTGVTAAVQFTRAGKRVAAPKGYDHFTP